jgi:selenocysteine-specific elongation factor
VARWGDRGVLRSYSPVTTIGGVVVADPWPAPRPRRPAALADCAAPDPAARVLAFVRKSGRRGVAQRDLPVRGGIHPGELARVLGAATQRGAVRVGERLVTADILGQLRSATLGALAGYHKSRPQDAGMPLELVRVASGGTDLADHILTELAAVGKVAVGGGVARLVEHRPALAGAQADAADAVRARLANAGWHGVTPQEAGDGVGPEVALEVLEYFVRQGTAVRVGRGRYYEKGALDRLRDTVLEEVRRLGRASPAQLRDRTGLTRKYLIPVLEWLDACGLTVRDGDARRLP